MPDGFQLSYKSNISYTDSLLASTYYALTTYKLANQGLHRANVCPVNIYNNDSSNINRISSEEIVAMVFLIFVLPCGCFQLVEHYGNLIVLRLIPGC